MTEFLIEPAGPGDEGPLRGWLPQAFLGSPRPWFFVARSGDGVAGAASLRVIRDGRGVEQARFLVFVEAARRRQGCGTALMRAVIAAARKTTAAELLAGRSLDESDPLNAFCAAVGLEPLQQRVQFEIGVQRLLDIYGLLCRKIEEDSQDRKSFCIQTIDECVPTDIAAFVVRHMGGFIEPYLAGLRSGRYDTTCSLRAEAAGRLVGVLLTRAGGEVADVDVLALEHGWRDGTLSAVMKHELAARLQPLGVNRVRFEADEARHRATAKSARRSKAAETSRKILYGLPLKSPN